MIEIYKNVTNLVLDGEIWKNIEGYNGDYQVSNLGRIKSFKKCRGIEKKILRQNRNTGGYLFVNLSKNGKIKPNLIHILMFETFNNYKLKEDECIHHINENKINNMLENFKLMIKSKHNNIHMINNNPMSGKYHSIKTKELIKNHTNNKGENNPNSILTEQKVIEIWKYLDEGILTQKEIGKLFGVSTMTISYIKNNKIWKNIKEKY